MPQKFGLEASSAKTWPPVLHHSGHAIHQRSLGTHHG